MIFFGNLSSGADGRGVHADEKAERREMRRSASVFCFPAHDRITPKTVAKAVDGGFKAFPFFILFFSIIQKGELNGNVFLIRDQGKCGPSMPWGGRASFDVRSLSDPGF